MVGLWSVANWTGTTTVVPKSEVKPTEQKEVITQSWVYLYQGNRAWLCSYCKSQIFETFQKRLKSIRNGWKIKGYRLREKTAYDPNAKMVM